MSTLLLADPPVYGPVFQGEGNLIGTKTHFVRFAACDYRCSWCDTPYAVLTSYKAEWRRYEPAAVADMVSALPPAPWVTLSGGNPALQDLEQLIDLLKARGFRVACETQGSAAPSWLSKLDALTLSPKPPSSGHKTLLTALFAVISKAPSVETCVKIVIMDDADLDYAVTVFNELPDSVAKVLQTCTTQSGTLERHAWLERKAIERNIDARVLPQLHALVHGNGRRDV